MIDVDTMRRPPRAIAARLFSKRLVAISLSLGLSVTAILLGAFAIAHEGGSGGAGPGQNSGGAVRQGWSSTRSRWASHSGKRCTVARKSAPWRSITARIRRMAGCATR